MAGAGALLALGSWRPAPGAGMYTRFASKSKKTQPHGAALAERKHWLTPKWLAKYAPELNDIEREWQTLDAHRLAYKTFKNRNELKTTIDADIQEIASTRRESQPKITRKTAAFAAKFSRLSWK